MRKVHQAKERGDAEVVVWGTGSARREFLHVDDMADACVFLMKRYDGGQIMYIGTGEDISIGDVALSMKRVVGFEGRIVQDTTKADGTPCKLLDVSRLKGLGWAARRGLVRETYGWYRGTQREVGVAPEYSATPSTSATTSAT